MKKVFTILFCLLGMMASADDVKLALLQPRVAEGSDACRPIELNMVRGELRKAFGWQSDFQVLTRTDVDEILKEHSFQSSGMVNDEQRKRIGDMTGAQYVCVSTITKDGSQLYIESYLVNIETGEMTNPATQLANVQNGDYTTLQNPCNELAKEMLGELGGNTNKKSKIGSRSVKEIPAGYVDLGLPSGTLWKDNNEVCGLITYDQAVNFYGNSLPTKEQFEELINNCLWIWNGYGYTVQGRNGNNISLPAEGFKHLRENIVYNIRITGDYWSSTLSDENMENAWGLYFCTTEKHSGFTPGDKFVNDYSDRNTCCSIRLVRNKY